MENQKRRKRQPKRVKSNKQTKKVISKKEFNEQCAAGAFTNQDGNIIIHDLCIREDESDGNLGQGINSDQENIRKILIEDCQLPDGFTIYQSCDIIMIDCTGSDIWIESENASLRFEVAGCTFDQFSIGGATPSELCFRYSEIQNAIINLEANDPVGGYSFHFLKFKTGALEVFWMREKISKWTELALTFSPDDDDDSDKSLPLVIRRFFKTNIPQFAAFVRMMCPSTPIHFEADMRELLSHVPQYP